MKTKATIKNYRTWAAMMLGKVIIRAFDAHIRAFESYIWAHAQIYASHFLQIPLGRRNFAIENVIINS